MALHYKPQTQVDWNSRDAYSQYRLWRKEVERIINGPLHEEFEEVKLNHVFIWAGAQVERLVEAKQAEDPTCSVATVDELLDCLDGILTHSTHFREAREDFYNAKQTTGENTTAFYSRILELHKQAEFPVGSDFLIVDKLIHGCTNVECKRKLMTKEKTVTVKTCLDVLRRYESVDATMQRFTETQVHATYSHDPSRRSQQRGGKPKTKQPTDPRAVHREFKPATGDSNRECRWCGGQSHARDRCPAQDVRCNFCKKTGHFEKVCRLKKSVKTTNAVQIADTDLSAEEDTCDHAYDISTVQPTNVHAREVMADVTFHTTGDHCLQGKVDTGAMTTCMPISLLPKVNIKQQSLLCADIRLRSVTGASIPVSGKIKTKVTCNGITRTVEIIITNAGTELILGLEFCKQFKLVQISDVCIQRNINVEAVHVTEESDVDYESLQKKWRRHLPLGKETGDPMEDLKRIFPDMFDGSVGLFDGEAELKLTPGATPVQLPPRAVPVSVLPRLKNELDRMEAEGIIRPCPETTSWVHNLVIVVKKSGDIRVCLDPKNLNKCLVRNIHYTASWEDAKNTFKNGKYFSTLDAKSGYWTQMLSPESQPLTAFNTPFKKYCFVRLPFGLSVSSEIFCAQMDKALAGVPGTFPCADDVKIQGSTEERHDIHLLETVSRAKAAGIKFNPDKCQVKKRRIEYFGRIISPDGVEPCPKKVKAILQLGAPENKQELQSFLGSVNFMSNFIPNLAQKTVSMRGLLKKDVRYTWTSDMQTEFESVKTGISQAMKLTHFDPAKQVVIETDASLKGLGAVLLQNGRPVKFLSKSLTPTESEYSNIERELLAVLFACEKLHVYVFGRRVNIHTDHKPLESIFRKPISLAPPRLQRMLLRLRTYDVHVEYVGAKHVPLADTLSRLVKPGSDPTIPGLDVSIAQVLKIRHTRLANLQEETKCDPVLSTLGQLISNGWPESMQDLPDTLQHYWCFRDELSCTDGLIMKGSRVVVPSKMQADTLQRLHDGHQGLSAILKRARRSVYWLNMQNEITDLANGCEECQIHGAKKPRPPERQISTTRPMEVLGCDLMDFQGQPILVSIDYFSGYIFIDPLRNSTTSVVTARLNDNFRRFGLAERVISDNGPCFRSDQFQKFCELFEIHHTTTSPYHHQSNGRVERAIRTVRNILKKCKNDTEITLAILAYLDTPISSDLPSPAELFLNRRINTRLGQPLNSTHLTEQQKLSLTDKRSAHLKPQRTPQIRYAPQQPIWYTEDCSSEWKAGYIDIADMHPDSYWIITQTGSRLRRNQRDIKVRYPFNPPSAAPHHTELNFPDSGDDAPPVSTDGEVTNPVANESTPHAATPVDCPVNIPVPSKPVPPEKPSPALRRSGRVTKSTKDPNFVYSTYKGRC